VADFVQAPFRRARRARPAFSSGSDADSTIWALRDFSVDIKYGEVVGIVGSNGAGKSTLLKILSRVTEPTSGKATLHGRVGSLLEVGTGFHPELTGRENIFLNAAILGMRKSDIVLKFDDIVAFAEVERFIDTPVKRYSSGMQTRLAFSVAAHLEPEILLVDEVLAVGDGAFQRKCLAKMNEVSSQGRTVLLVSHQMNQIRRLCTRTAWLEGGRLVEIGATPGVLAGYERSQSSPNGATRERGSHGQAAHFVRWALEDAEPGCEHQIDHQNEVSVSFWLRVNQRLRRAKHGIAFLKDGTQNLWGTAHVDLELEPGLYKFVHTIPMLPFQPGVYDWQVSIYSDEGMIDLWDCTPAVVIGTRPLTHYRDEYAGVLNLRSNFAVVTAPDPKLEPLSSVV
jgi:lipopolysaccharide transport system ATP-binding protein